MLLEILIMPLLKVQTSDLLASLLGGQVLLVSCIHGQEMEWFVVVLVLHSSRVKGGIRLQKCPSGSEMSGEDFSCLCLE